VNQYVLTTAHQSTLAMIHTDHFPYVIKVFFACIILSQSSLAFSQSNKNEIGVYYLIAADDRNGQNASATDAQLQAGIAQLNRDFDVVNISFVLLDKVYLTNSDVTGIHQGKWDTAHEEQVRPFSRYGALNVVVADLDGKNGHAYWNYEATDMIQVEPEDLGTSTISHEFGHNLGLLHTYQSIDDGPITLLEGVNGWQYGDKVIDTAVDPGERSYYNDCIYSASAVDDAGNAYHPDGFNIMGKGQNTCRNHFSAEQVKRIRRVLLSDKFHLLNTFAAPENPNCSNEAISAKQGLTEGFNYNDEPQSNSWRQDSYTDDFNWKFYNYTSTSGTGANSPQEGHSFLHIDASHELVSVNDTINLISPCFTFEQSSTAQLSFYYSMYGADTGTLSVQVTTDNGESWQNLWSKSGQQHQSGASWTLATVALEAYIKAPFQLRFSAQVIGGSKGDISLDNVSITQVESPAEKQESEQIDRHVDEITFVEQVGVELDVMVYSQEVVVLGINSEIELSINNGEYSFACQADAYSAESMKVNNGGSLCIRHSSAVNYEEQVVTKLVLGQQNFFFISTTKSEQQTSLEEDSTTAPATSADVTIPDPVTSSEPVTSPGPVTVANSQEEVTEPIHTQEASAGVIGWLALLGLVLCIRRST